MTDYAHAWLGFDLIVWCETDVACRLTLLWTDKEEQVHLKSATDRGLGKMADPKFCFVEYHSVMQNQAGDTFKHTFTIPGWLPCYRRWWMFRGTIAGVASKSNTCIFTAHYPDQEEAVSLLHTDLEEKEVIGVIDHADDSIPGEKMRAGFTWPFFPLTPSAAPTLAYHVANKKYVDDQAAPNPWDWLQTLDIHVFSDFGNWWETTVNTGVVNKGVTRGECRTGAGAGSFADLYTSLFVDQTGGTPRDRMNWNYPIEIVFFGSFGALGSSATRYAHMRLAGDNTGGPLAQPGVAFRFNRNGNRLYAESHDLSALESTELTGVHTETSQIRRFKIVHDPGVAVRFYFNDVLHATHTVRVPSGVISSSAMIHLIAENPGEAADIRLLVNRIIFKKTFNW